MRSKFRKISRYSSNEIRLSYVIYEDNQVEV